MRERNDGLCHPGEAMAVTLTVPAPWADAIVATARALHDEFEGVPRTPFAPHISLCQRFFAGGSSETLATTIGSVFRDLPSPRLHVGGVRSFQSLDGTPEVVYIAVEAAWLRTVNQRLVFATRAYRSQGVPAPGNAAFDLDGFTPHITVFMPRDLPAYQTLHRSVTARAAALWAAARPAGDAFQATEAVLSAIDNDDWENRAMRAPLPRTIRRWRLSGIAEAPSRRDRRSAAMTGPIGAATPIPR